ncbi:asparaginase [Corynebacterium sp.]|uniref:asparaginase n=1 Tax=Corynebacterium sp. TaxID=1720 RepID=UPI0026DC26C3|nr:asparaginase [Corynebacterium sp.]MDO5031404.1 asparaginase [Corynebacterium sp.]
MSIALIATGGTIACTTQEDGSLIPTVSGHHLADDLRKSTLERVPDFEVIEFRALDSSSITLRDLDDLLATVHAQLARPDIEGIIITHGTDSMEETAMALELFHPGTKPVVLTGAQRSFDHPNPDGQRNLRDALALTLSGHTGVYIQFGGMTIPARGARKNHTAHLNGFESMRVAPPVLGPLPLAALAEHPVAIISAYPGAEATLVDASLPHFSGLVIEAMGSGNVGEEMGTAVARALDRGVAVVISTRVPYGSTTLAYGGAGGGATLGDKGAVHAHGLRPGQARIMLAAALATGTPVADMFATTGG